MRPVFESLEGRVFLSAAPASHAAERHAAVTPGVRAAARAAAHLAKQVARAANQAAHAGTHHKGSGGVIDPIYMNIPGLSGDVLTKGFAGNIELNSLRFDVDVPYTSPIAGGPRIGKVNFSEITVTKLSDTTSPALLKDTVVGVDIPEIDISFVNLIKGKDGVQMYAQYVLSDVLISGYHVNSGGDRPTESLSLNFTKITYSYFTQNADGSVTTTSTTYDLDPTKQA